VCPDASATPGTPRRQPTPMSAARHASAPHPAPHIRSCVLLCNAYPPLNSRESSPAAHPMKTVPQPTRENRRATQHPAPIRHNDRPDDPAEDKSTHSNEEPNSNPAARGRARIRSTPNAATLAIDPHRKSRVSAVCDPEYTKMLNGNREAVME